jgi:hypothetical protein
MEKYIQRQVESEVIRLASKFPAIGIVGPRQIGKTTLARHVSSQLTKNSSYFDLEYPEDWAALQEPVRLLERMQDEVVIIDEVQRMPTLFPVLRALIDRHRVPGRFILLGSASPELIRQSSESLAGRIVYLELTPFALSELPNGINWETHWLRGGFPESLLASDDQSSSEWRISFIRSYLERDLQLLGLNADPVLLRRLWTMLAHLNGQLLNKQTLSGSLGISTSIVGRYIDFFESAFLITRLQPFVPNLGKRLVKSPKVYIKDTGILHQLLNIQSFQGLLSHPGLGASWESYVLHQISAHLPFGYEMYFYRTHEGAEADMVITNGGVPEMLVEVKFSTTPQVSKGFFNVQADLGVKSLYLIAPVTRSFPGKNGIEVIGVQDIPNMFR